MKIFNQKRNILLVLLLMLMGYAIMSMLFIDVNVFLVKEQSFFLKFTNKYLYQSKEREYSMQEKEDKYKKHIKEGYAGLDQPLTPKNHFVNLKMTEQPTIKINPQSNTTYRAPAEQQQTFTSPSKTEKLLTKTDKPPKVTDHTPVKATQSPVKTDKSPVKTDQSPVKATQPSVKTNQTHVVKTDKPPVKIDQPPTKTDQAPVKLDKSSVKTDQPAKTDKPPVETESLKHDGKKVFKCPDMSIKKRYEISSFNLSCKPRPPSPSGCKYAIEKYIYNQTINTCKKQSTIRNICNRLSNGKFECSFDSCGEHFHEDIFIHIFDETDGDIDVYANVDRTYNLAHEVEKAANHTMKKGYNFMFLSCGKMVNKTQFVVLPPLESHKTIVKPSNKININIFIYDSISRAHFYRSLKHSIEAMNDINTNSHKYHNAEVLDFELFQSIHGHSQENTYALMTGEIFPSNVSLDDRERTPVKLQEFYKFLKDNGYNTLYQDDMCYQSGYGLKRDFGALGKDFDEFKGRLDKESNIDDYGLSFANCKLIMDVFDGDSATFNMNGDQNVCYNGRPNDAYLLDYNLAKFRQAQKLKKKLFSYNNLQFSHDGIGYNIQTMDDTVSNFLYNSTTLENTLTIILADHGNSYTGYTVYEMEGRYEQYHPALFMVVPERLQKLLGKTKFHAMRLNQKRLLTMVDIHNGIHHIVDSKHTKKGFLRIIPDERTCNDIKLGKPNLCACAGSDSPADNKTEYIGHLEFAIGKLNNLITNNSIRGHCKRIVPLSLINVLQRSQGDGVVLNFDIITEAGKGSANKEERFTFEVFFKESESSRDSFAMELRNALRVSKFGKYNKVCSDVPDHAFRYCICDMDLTNKSTAIEVKSFTDLLLIRSSPYYEIERFSDYNVTPEESFIDTEKEDISLYIREYTSTEIKIKDGKNETINYLHSVTFEALHIGKTNKHYEIEVSLNEMTNLMPMNLEPCKGIVKPKSIYYLCTIRRDSSRTAEYKYSYTVKEV